MKQGYWCFILFTFLYVIARNGIIQTLTLWTRNRKLAYSIFFICVFVCACVYVYFYVVCWWCDHTCMLRTWIYLGCLLWVFFSICTAVGTVTEFATYILAYIVVNLSERFDLWLQGSWITGWLHALSVFTWFLDICVKLSLQPLNHIFLKLCLILWSIIFLLKRNVNYIWSEDIKYQK